MDAHDLRPPGTTTVPRAGRALVIAPHADDDVIGCSGTLDLLRERGCEISVLFLTDSSGGDEPVADPAAYAAVRRAEAAAGLAVLGIVDLAFRDLPDGRLADHVEAAAEAIADALLRHRPELVFAISPLESTADHRAAFWALHRVLSPLRGGTELDEAVRDCRVLLYDINHPGYPDVLVDVSDRMDRVEAAIRSHSSQLERHNYLDAALGMRRYRTLSLGPEVAAAEGFRSLRPADFTASGPAGLVQRLGGSPRLAVVRQGPRLSVVVRTRDRPELLAEALGSLAAQSYRRAEVVVVNDGGATPELPEGHPLELRLVDLPANRGRGPAADAGVEAATGDWIAFLDDDDLAEPDHLEVLAGLAGAAGTRVAYTDAAVGVYELGPAGWREVERRLPYSRDFDPDLLLVDNYIPFNTVVIERQLLADAGKVDSGLEFFEDWDLLIRLAQRTPFRHLRRVTCEYRHFRGGGHHVLGERPDARGDFLAAKATVIGRYRELLTPDRVARVVGRLREEAVVASEAAGGQRSEAEHARRERAEWEDRWHRLNGELHALRAEHDRLGADHRELGRIHAEVAADRDRLAASAAEQAGRLAEIGRVEEMVRESLAERDGQLTGAYREIERLNALVQTMEGTRAWRLHRFVEKLRGRRG